MRPYLSKTQPIPPVGRKPWFRYLAPCYFGIFAWVGYTQGLSHGTIDRAPFGLLFFGIFIAALLSQFLFFRIPATMGMQTGYPSGVIGSSTFGSQGGHLVPGILLGLLQAALLGVTAYLAGKAIVVGFGLEGGAAQSALIGVAVVWSLGFALAGNLGIGVVSLAAMLAAAPLLASAIGLFTAKEGIAEHGLDLPEPFAAFTYVIHLVTAFFATIAASSPGLARHSESKRGLQIGGLFGIVLPACLFGFIALATVAGARYLNPGLESFGYLEAVAATAGRLAPAVCLLIVAGSIPAALLISWMASDSFRVMLPDSPVLVGRGGIGLIAAGVAAAGLPENLPVFFTVTAALSAPICGIMAADYWQHDKRWPHTRPGVNYAGYGAWVLGIIVGIVPLLPIPEHLVSVAHPAAVYSCIAGFVGYIVLGNLGLKPYRKHRRKRVRKADFSDVQPGLAGSQQARDVPQQDSSESVDDEEYWEDDEEEDEEEEEPPTSRP